MRSLRMARITRRSPTAVPTIARGSQETVVVVVVVVAVSLVSEAVSDAVAHVLNEGGFEDDVIAAAAMVMSAVRRYATLPP